TSEDETSEDETSEDETSEDETSEDETSEDETSEAETPVTQFPLSEGAIRDDIYIASNDQIEEVISLFKTYSWGPQSSAITWINQNLNSTEFQNYTIDDLFVIGRNILQTAVGNSWSALEFINDRHFNSFPEDVSKMILAGMVFEIYFNRRGELRDTPKVTPNIYKTINREINKSKYEKVKQFIQQKFEETNPNIIHKIFEANKLVRITGEFNDEDELISLLADNTVFTEISDIWSLDNVYTGTSNCSKDSILNSISRHYNIPKEFMTTELDDIKINSELTFKPMNESVPPQMES
ncbi:MAG: hypothetical protein ACQEQV_08585, partial [Fibrobacterota bacterium]